MPYSEGWHPYYMLGEKIDDLTMDLPDCLLAELDSADLPTGNFHVDNRFTDGKKIGDDIQAQLGATIVHRVLTDLFAKRGVKLERTYQLNTGGNTDFLNMLDRHRLSSKKESKTEAVQAMLAQRLAEENILIGPSAYFCKHPPEQFIDDVALRMVDEYIAAAVPQAAE